MQIRATITKNNKTSKEQVIQPYQNIESVGSLVQIDIMNNTSTTPVPDIYGCLLSDQEIADSYNLGLHVASVFVLLFVSLLGACFSVLSTRVPSLHINPIIINTGKFFGIGYVEI